MASLLVAGLIAGACGDDDARESALPGSLEELDAGGEPAVVFLPEGDVAGLVIYHHGAGETLDAFVEIQDDGTVVGELVKSGWAVAASEAHGNHWGSQDAIDANAALWEALPEQAKADKVVLMGLSMGGLSSLTCIVQECVPGIDGWIGIYPLVDHRTLVGSTIAEEALAGVEETFGGPPPPELIPLEQAERLAQVPMLMWASPGDTYVSMDANAAELARRVTAAGGQVTLHEAQGEHGDLTHYDPAAVLAFVGSL